MSKIIETPILLIGFNRPDTTKIVFESIRKVKPKRLYVAIDGPRLNKQGEADLCKQVLEITKKVDWDCDAKYLIRDENLGCKLGVSGAITWAFENEEKLIIIEDDIVAVPAFFSFAEELLEKFKNDEKIAMISANQYTPITMDNDYLFTKYGHIWGWGTWKRVWDKFDISMPFLQKLNQMEQNSLTILSKKEEEYFKNYFSHWQNLMDSGAENAWDPQFAMHRFLNNLLSIAPKVNLASNIGTNSSRTDKKSQRNENYYPAEPDFILTNHPMIIECDTVYDNHHLEKHLNRKSSPIKRVFRKVKTILKLK